MALIFTYDTFKMSLTPFILISNFFYTVLVQYHVCIRQSCSLSLNLFHIYSTNIFLLHLS
jgi:hypothetical protein